MSKSKQVLSLIFDLTLFTGSGKNHDNRLIITVTLQIQTHEL